MQRVRSLAGWPGPQINNEVMRAKALKRLKRDAKYAERKMKEADASGDYFLGGAYWDTAVKLRAIYARIKGN